VEEIKAKVNQAPRDWLAVDRDVPFIKVPAAGADQQRCRLRIELVLAAIRVLKGDAAPHGIEKIALTIDHVVPGW
jgi:hypothetical protein